MQNTQFSDIITHLEEELRGIRTNRANPSMVENITVMAYGSPMKLLEIASISTPEPQQIVIQPWDKSLLQAIESAVAGDAKLQVSPVVDGELIRISLPPLTEDRRKELVKLMGGITEQARIQVRKIREQLLKDAKASEKSGDISEDAYFRLEKDIQAQVDSANQLIEQHASSKEKELMTI